jgi:hypothetical protein
MLSPTKRVMLKHIKFYYSRWPWTTLQTSTPNWIMKTCTTWYFVLLAYILRQLEFVHVLIKFAQMKDVFVCNLVVTM